MTRVFCSDAASEAPRFTAVVVLPTPPFWLAIAITRAKLFPPVWCENLAEWFRNVQVVSRETTFRQNNVVPTFHVEQSRSPQTRRGGRSRQSVAQILGLAARWQ